MSILKEADELASFVALVRETGSGYLFFQDKLGGEISIVGTSCSPELSFDVTLIEIQLDAVGEFIVTRFGVLEIQTMDYHGTYAHAVNNLRDGLRLHPRNFPQALAASLEHWAGQGVEGPNIANVFKRTFYQMLLKFKLSGAGSAAAGTVLALPRSVWDSWQPFLGAPKLEDESPGIRRLQPDPDSPPEPQLNAFICVMDLDAEAEQPVSPVEIGDFIRVSPERMAHHAFSVVPAHILNAIQADESVLARIRMRLAQWWPAFKTKPMTKPATPVRAKPTKRARRKPKA